MKNPEAFDGKSSTTFNQWWETVTMFLGFYPEMGDQQNIAWVLHLNKLSQVHR